MPRKRMTRPSGRSISTGGAPCIPNGSSTRGGAGRPGVDDLLEERLEDGVQSRAPVEGAELDDALGVVPAAEAEDAAEEVAEPAGGPRLQPAGREQLPAGRAGDGKAGQVAVPLGEVRRVAGGDAGEAPLERGGGGGRVTGRVAAGGDVGGEGGEVPVEQRRPGRGRRADPGPVGGDDVDDGWAEGGEVGAVDG